jgi:aminoglycoside phosphotransferase (APT) family kinase protein
VWRHADLTVGNLLVDNDRLSAVIDFGPSGLGDPAVDLVPAWRVFRGEARELFRRNVEMDEQAWTRAMGWAASIALLELAYYRDRDQTLADAARAALGELQLTL